MAPTQFDEKPKPGDLIEIKRGLYQHWAVYVGEGYVVHLTPPPHVASASSSSVMSVQDGKSFVKKEKLREVVGDSKWKINNDLDKKYKPRAVDVIVSEAHAAVGQELPYSIHSRNCEHFANQLRYGKAESRQVQNAVEAVAAGGLLGAGLALIAGVAGALDSQDTKK